jgi:hypothetical protein
MLEASGHSRPLADEQGCPVGVSANSELQSVALASKKEKPLNLRGFYLLGLDKELLYQPRCE